MGSDAEVTAREAEILALVARHLTNAQIADALVISPRTVESHVSAMLRKLQLPDRRSLARHAEAMPGLLVKSGRHGLPLPVTSFIGRTGERAALTAALAGHRLVTATGPGGIGKTRLALSVATEAAPARRAGVWFLDLVHVTDPALVTAAVAETVGVPEQRTTSIERALVAVLAESDALLVLDNCEHVLDGVRACVDRIIAGCPGITVLATSRTRLLLPYERVYVVPGLSVSDAVDLFTARVAAVTGDAGRLDAARVATLCRALDGMALAIELAGARFAALGLDGLESGLGQRLRFLTAGTGGTARHGSLRDAIGWSYELLSPADRALLRRVSVFASWFDAEAAHAVTDAGRERAEVVEGLARLAEHSLLVVERGEPTRYRALETIRQYGVERLDETGELGPIRDGHARWCRSTVDALRGRDPAGIDEGWCAALDRVVDDVDAAVAWSASADLAADLAGLLFLRGHQAQAERRYELAATIAGEPDHLRLAAGAAAGRFAGDDALRLLRKAADAALSAGDRAGAARDLATMAMYIDRAPGIMATPHSPAEADALVAEARALSDDSPATQAALALATGWRDLNAPGNALRAAELAETAGDRILHSIALDLLTAVRLAGDDIAEAGRVARRRLEVIGGLEVGALGGFEIGDAHLMAVEADLALGNLAGAAAGARTLAALPFYRDEDHLATCRRLLVDAFAGHFDDVVRNGERFRIGWERAGRPVARNLARGAYAVAMAYGMRGDDDRREAWIRRTIDLGADADDLAGCVLGWPPVFDAVLALHRGDPAAAVRRLAADIDDPSPFRSSTVGPCRPWYAALWAEAAVLDHHADAAERIERARHAARDNPIAAAIVERAAALTAGDRDTLVGLTVTFAALGCPYQQTRTASLVPAIRLRPGTGSVG
ncbi:ATP-binding protein [Paractinoplanes globisporus]|uniref:ATP-binding protein n=1 Tax=Paractinoplanes globisporus TaxID=113565 RepID=A0ABW6WBK8_9ACTN|nr:LuxR C-terminal-related transcriptional regulator [Actinoplanes globisporus]